MNEGFTRRLGRSKIEVSALGLGSWAIGGPFTYNGLSDGWGNVDDTESFAYKIPDILSRRRWLTAVPILLLFPRPFFI
jgi:hypothetical protein